VSKGFLKTLPHDGGVRNSETDASRAAERRQSLFLSIELDNKN